MMTFTVTPDEANLLLGALQELPFKVSATLINKLMAQGQAQVAAAGKAVEVEVKQEAA